MPVYYDLVPVHTDERLAAKVVLQQVSQSTIFGDKGFLGLNGQTSLFNQTCNTIYTPKHRNQAHQQPFAFEHWLHSVRKGIETPFHVLQNTGRHLKRLLAKSVVGLCTRVAAQITSQLLNLFYAVILGFLSKLFNNFNSHYA